MVSNTAQLPTKSDQVAGRRQKLEDCRENQKPAGLTTKRL